MSTVSLDYAAAHTFVDRNKFASWEGWDILLFSPTDYGRSHPDGAFVNGTWGMQVRVSPDDNGRWNIKQKSRRKA